MDDATLSFEQLLKCAQAHRNKEAGLGQAIGKGVDWLAGKGMGGAKKMMGGIGTGAKHTYNWMGTNPGKVTAGIGGVVGAGALGPGGMGARALGSMGVIDDPVKQYGSNRVTADNMRKQYYDNDYMTAFNKYQTALAQGSATQQDYDNLQEIQSNLNTGNYGGGWFGKNQNYYQQRAMDAAGRMQQPYQPSFLKRMFGGYADQAGYNQYAKDQLSSYGVKAPPGFAQSRAAVGRLLPKATQMHRDTGEMFTQASPMADPAQQTLQNYYSGQDRLQSAFR